MNDYPKAMHGPDKGYMVVKDAESEAALREDGWIDGHEFWTQHRAETEETTKRKTRGKQ